MNALTLKGGKIYLVPDVPEKPELNAWSASPDDYDKEMIKYNGALLSQLNNKIEVAPESRKIARDIIFKGEKITAENAKRKEGELYPIEGLEYTLEMVWKNEDWKQLAVLTYKK